MRHIWISIALLACALGVYAGQQTVGGVGFSGGGSTTAAAYCQLSMPSAVSLSNVTATVLSPTTETYDTASMYSAGAPTRVTIPLSGIYLVTAVIEWGADDTGNRRLFLRSGGSLYLEWDYNFSGNGREQSIASTRYFASGEYLEVLGYQNSGGALNGQLLNFSVLLLGEV